MLDTNKNNSRRLQLERLESRHLMATSAGALPHDQYDAQVQEQQLPGVEQREIRLGDVDRFRRNAKTDAAAAWADPAWLREVSAAARGKVMGLDRAATNKWVPLSFNFNLAPGEQVVGATLSLGLRGTAKAKEVRSNRVYFDSLDSSQSVAKLGWGAIPRSGTASRSVALSAYLGSLQDGDFDVALKNDLAVDWARLDIQVARPSNNGSPALFSASGDAQVRGGTGADTNYGSEAWLATMAGGPHCEAQESYLSFDLSNLNGNVVHAFVRLRMLESAQGATGSAALVAEDWDESSLTWNNKPASGQVLATWSGAAGEMASIDVADQINSLLAQGCTRLSLRIFATPGSGQITYGSREADVFCQPLLEVRAV